MTAEVHAPAGPPAMGWRDFARPWVVVALAWTLAQIAFVIWPTAIAVETQRASHVSFAIALALLLSSEGKGAAGRWLDIGLAVLALLPAAWIALSAERIEQRWAGLDPVLWQDWAGVVVLLLLLLEASRRFMGLGITLLAVAFIAYQLLGSGLPWGLGHRADDLAEFVDNQFLTPNGVFGVPTGVSVDIVFYFIFFAAVYELFGGGRMIIDLALALTGRTSGGPAKAAIVSSGLMGSVSGSAVANVMSTGIFTIPLMMRIRYRARFAGAVEAVASTGGQIMPPVMGAAAFVMADFLQMPYREIVLAAIMPALLYFLALGATVDLEARKLGLGVLAAADMPRVRSVLRDRGHMLLPLAWLVWRIVSGHGITYASLEAIALTVVCGLARGTTRRGVRAMLEVMVTAPRRAINVALPCAVASVIVSVIAFTGLGTKFTSLMIEISGGQVLILLMLAMVASLVLGAGMPTTSAYIMAAVLIAPALVQMGVDALLAHMFVFYFAIMSMLTPPVALSAYAAASISGASSSSTGWTAVTLAIPGFLVPYAFYFHPGLLLLGGAGDAIWGFASLLVAFYGLAVAIVGWLVRPMLPWERLTFAALGLMSIYPHLASTTVAVIGIGGAWLWLRRTAKA